MVEHYSKETYRNNLFAYYLTMARYRRVRFLFHCFLSRSFSILDLGCGVGEYLREIKNNVDKDILGLDLDCKVFKRGVCNFIPIRGDAENLSFKNEKFDLILFSEVFEHLPCPNKSLDEIRRVLKKDGILIISTPSRRSFYEKQYQASIIGFGIVIIQKILRRQRPKPIHISLKEISELKYELEKRHLVITHEYYTSFCLPFSHEFFNFLFNFKSVIRIYRKIDLYINNSKLFRSLNWIMIFICRKR